MINVVGVRFQKTGKSYYFDPLEYELKRGMHVIVETQRGREFGTVTIPPILVQDDKVVQPLRPIIRPATQEDEARNAENKEKSREAAVICAEKIRKYGLEMKLVETEYTFDRGKLLFYFTADGRVDFRELVKDLASVFRTRIELRQIGVRDETKIKGGLGMCGRELCCTTFLSDFAPVSIRMAKEQNLSLNPTKISGACGRLMCCLKNEQETYEYLNKQLPKTGQRVNTIDGIEGTVQSVNILKQTAKVILDQDGEKEIREYAAGEMAYGDHAFTCEPRRSQDDDLDYFSEQLRKAVAATHTGEEAGRDKDGNGHAHSRNRNGKSGRSRQGASGRNDAAGRERRPREASAHPEDAQQRTKRSAKQTGEQQNAERTQQGSGTSRRSSEKRRQNEKRRSRPEGENRRNPAAASGESAKETAGQQNKNKNGAKSNADRARGSRNQNRRNRSGQDTGAGTSRENRESRQNRTNGEEGRQSRGEHTRRERQGDNLVNRKDSGDHPESRGENVSPEKRSENRDRQEKSGRSRYRGRRRQSGEGKPQQSENTGSKQSDT